MSEDVKESTEYESLMGVKEKPNADLTSFMPELDETVVEEPWKQHWKEMPEYKQEDKKTFKTIQLHFRNKEDFEEFCRKYSTVDSEMKPTEKTKSMWYPKLEITKNSLMRWIEE
ncbi:MAG: hypothetical protein CMO44_06990 [Verrucomicrobiales bacterium]|nr:hypothetical protein [Verrucomicrobiales bacterium]